MQITDRHINQFLLGFQLRPDMKFIYPEGRCLHILMKES